MIVETLWAVMAAAIRPLLSWTTAVAILAPATLSMAILAYYWPVISRYAGRLRHIDNLPGPKCTSVLMGNIPLDIVWDSLFNAHDHRMLIINLMSSISGYTQVYRKEKLFRIWLSWEPLIFLWHPETVEKILANNFLLEKSAQYQFLHPWLGTGLLTSAGQKWRTRRKMLVPAFHFKILHDFVPVFNEHSGVLVQRLRQVARRRCANCTVVDIVPIITACTLDIICETIMGVSIGAQKSTNNKYCKSVNEVGECFLERLMQPQYWADQIYYRSGAGRKFSTNLVRLHAFTMNVIRNRKAERLNAQTPTVRYRPSIDGATVDVDQGPERDGRKAFLDLLIDHHLNASGPDALTEEDIREEVDTFMFEGHDTTAMALSWILYLLGHHPEIQARAAAEVDALFDQSDHEENPDQQQHPLTLENIKSLKYLECCIKEGLRLCPSVPFIGRRLHQDMDIGQYTVPNGTIIFVYIYMLHRDPDVYPNPEQFDPDRFLPERSVGRHPFAFVPFSAGPRNCIGQRFAMSELKVVLAYLLRYFRFESLDERDKIFTMMEMVLRPKSPLRLRVFERRKDETMFHHGANDSTTMEAMELLLEIGGQPSKADFGDGITSSGSSEGHGSLGPDAAGSGGSGSTGSNRSDDDEHQPSPPGSLRFMAD